MMPCASGATALTSPPPAAPRPAAASRRRTRPRVLILEERVEHQGILLEHIDADAPDLAGRQAAAKLGPVVAASVGFVEAALRPALDDLPRHAILVVHRREELRWR